MLVDPRVVAGVRDELQRMADAYGAEAAGYANDIEICADLESEALENQRQHLELIAKLATL